MTMQYHSEDGTGTFPSRRPAPADRKFTSPAVEETIRDTKARIADPEMAWLFENCFPSTLDTTVNFRESGGEGGVPDTFVITGDIDAMWLRDSAAQVWPYLPLARRAPPKAPSGGDPPSVAVHPFRPLRQCLPGRPGRNGSMGERLHRDETRHSRKEVGGGLALLPHPTGLRLLEGDGRYVPL